MSDFSYAVSPLRLTGKPALLEASKEELRVLLLLVESGGEIVSLADMAKAAGISEARLKSSLAFWEESSVITKRCDGAPAIIEEFEEKLRQGEIDEVESVQVAKSIRDDSLASMLDECAGLMGQACLSNADVKSITALHTQYALSAEFIVELAAHLVAKGALTVRRLCNEAIKLTEKNISTVESLGAYLKDMEESSGYEWEFRRLLGIYNRNLSPSEKSYFKKWAEELEFSVTIVSEAYDIAILNTKTGRADLRYMDSILTSWHEAGCKTLSQCKAHSEAKRAAEKNTPEQKKRAKTESPTPRYGNFDVNDAFMKALERSYGDD